MSEQQKPLVYMSTESELKHAAVTSAMERVGISVDVDGTKVASGVDEQPMTMDETYQGAMNRHRALRALGNTADYYVTIESGMAQPHYAAGTHGCNAVIIEPAGGEPQVGFAIDVEFPQAVLDMVPSQYSDYGTWAKQVHGATEKDPYPYFTDGHVTRRKTIEDAVFNTVIRLMNTQPK